MALGIIGAIIRVDGHEAHLMIAELAVCVTMYVVDMCVMCMYKCTIGRSLYFQNSFTKNWITFFKNYLHLMLKTETFLFICYKLAKLDQSTFYYTEMAGKLLNLNLASFKNYLTSKTFSY